MSQQHPQVADGFQSGSAVTLGSTHPFLCRCRSAILPADVLTFQRSLTVYEAFGSRVRVARLAEMEAEEQPRLKNSTATEPSDKGPTHT